MTFFFKLAVIAARTLEAKLSPRPSDIHVSVRNAASGEFHGTVIQIGTVHGDLNVHEDGSDDAPSAP